MSQLRNIGWAALVVVGSCGAVSGEETVQIPAVWKKTPAGMYKESGGYGWFRCQVEIPKEWKGKELSCFLEPIDDARELYLNGVRVGGSGTFPPNFVSGLGGAGRFNVTQEAVKFGEKNGVAVRVFVIDGRHNFNVAAPVLFGGDQAIRLEGEWQFKAADDAAWGKEIDPKMTAFSTLANAEEVEKTLKKLADEAGPLSPIESWKTMETPDDLEVELVLSEPQIGQPLSIKFDERGRMWVVQYLQYPMPAGLKMLSRDKFLRSVYDKVPPAPPNHFKGADKISIHEDTNGDGKYDKHTTFIEGLSLVSAFEWGREGVWVLNPPYLLHYPDKNHDDVPDGDPVVHLEGFGIEDSHSVVNNLRWGPDGWLYAAQGSTVTGDVKRPGLDKQGVHSLGQLIWRYHPETRRYEIFAEGGGNTFGVELDAKGRIFSGTNGGNSRGYHYVQGGYFRKGFDKHGQLSNPYSFGYFPDMTHHPAPRFTHCYLIYEGQGLPEKYAGRMFGVGPLQSHVLLTEVMREGSSFKTKDIGPVISTLDTWFRPVDIQAGPDGCVYVADFYEQRIDHASHYQGRVDQSSGRIYRLKAKGAQPQPKFDLGKLSTPQVIELLSHPDKWHRQTALRLLAARSDPSSVAELKKKLAASKGQTALETLWALNLSGGFEEPQAAEFLNHADPFVRLWTVRLLGDGGTVSSPVARQLAELAVKEKDVEVRSQLACSAKRLPAEQCLPIVSGLLQHDEDTDDIHLPLLLWWAVEAHAAKHRDLVLQLLADPQMWSRPLVEKHLLERVMKRYAMSGTRQDLLACAKLLELAPTKAQAQRLLTGFEQAYEGRTLPSLPTEMVAALSKAGGGSLALRLRQGEKAAVEEALRTVADEKSPVAKRLQLAAVLGQIREPRCVPVLLEAVATSKDDTLRATSLNSLQPYDDSRIPPAIVKLHNQLPEDVRMVAQTLLASRSAWSLAFLKALDAGQVDAAQISTPIVRKVLLHPNPEIATLVRKHWGEVQGATTEGMRQEVERLVQVLQAGVGNPYPGKKLFMDSCGKCHTLFGQGGKIGPDLTAYKRDDSRVMLLHVVNPSAEIREGYENYVVVTDDGRMLNGFIADQDSKVVVLRGIDGQSVVIPRDEVDEMAAVPRSLMPEGLLLKMKEQEIRDLFGYLRSTQPLSN